MRLDPPENTGAGRPVTDKAPAGAVWGQRDTPPAPAAVRGPAWKKDVLNRTSGPFPTQDRIPSKGPPSPGAGISMRE